MLGVLICTLPTGDYFPLSAEELANGIAGAVNNEKSDEK